MDSPIAVSLDMTVAEAQEIERAIRASARASGRHTLSGVVCSNVAARLRVAIIDGERRVAWAAAEKIEADNTMRSHH